MSKKETSRRDFLMGPLRRLKGTSRFERDEQPLKTEPGEPQDSGIKPPHSALVADFSGDQLYLEVMRLGYDPATMSEKQMLELISRKLTPPGNANENNS